MFSIAIELGAPNNIRHYSPLPVLPQLRGYTGEGSQLRADISAGHFVSITGLAAHHCPTGRDLFLEKRLKVDAPSWERSVLGKIVDSLLAKFLDAGLIYMEDAFEASVQSNSAVDLSSLEALILAAGYEIIQKHLADWSYPNTASNLAKETIDSFADLMACGGQSGADLIANTIKALQDLVKYETKLLMRYLKRLRRGRPKLWMAETKATLARLQAEYQLDKKEEGKLFGLSQNIKPDFLYAVTLIGDVKTGKYYEFYESVATGYAIYAEYALRKRINTAAILAIDLDLVAGKLRSHRVKIVRPTNEKRQLWVTRRDSALKIVGRESAPQHPSSPQPCQSCLYRSHCWVNGTPGGTPTTPSEPVKKGKPGSKAVADPSVTPV